MSGCKLHPACCLTWWRTVLCETDENLQQKLVFPFESEGQSSVPVEAVVWSACMRVCEFCQRYTSIWSHIQRVSSLVLSNIMMLSDSYPECLRNNKTHSDCSILFVSPPQLVTHLGPCNIRATHIRMKSKLACHLWIIALKIKAGALQSRKTTKGFNSLLCCRLFGSEPFACCSERKPLISAKLHIEDKPALSSLVHRPRNQQARVQDSIFRYPRPLSLLWCCFVW